MKTNRTLPSSRPAATLLALMTAALLVSGAAAAINTFNTGTSLSTAGNWSAGFAPSPSSSAGSYQDLLFTSSSTGLTVTSSIIYGQSLNVTNGSSYTITAITGSTNIRAGSTGSSGTETLATFTNGVSGVGNDLVYLSGNSNLTLSAGTASPFFNLRQAGNFNISSGSVFTSNLIISQTTTLSSGLNINGAGTTIFNAANTYTGLTTVNGGTLRYGVNDALATGGVTVAGGILDLQAFSDTVGAVILSSGTISGNGTLTGTSYTLTTGTVDATLGGAATVAIGAGLVNLNGANVNTGSTTVASGGTLKLGNSSALGTTANGTTVSTGGVLDLNGQAIGAEALSLSGLGISQAGALVNTNAASASLSGAVTLGANASIGAGNITLGNIGESGGSRSLTKVGSGTLTVSGTSSYSGGTTISDGTLNFTGGNNAGGLFTLSGANGPVLKLSNVNALASSASLFGASSVANTGTVDLAAAGAYTLGSYTGNNMKFTASSGNSTSLTFTNNSTVTSGSSGGRTITNGDANLAILFNGTLDISSSAAGNGVTFAGAGNTTVSGAVFNGSGQLRTLDKSGAGTLTLNGDNSYGGNTTINGTGMVLINGNTSASTGAVNVGSSATLGGLGTVGGAVTLSASSSIGSTGNTLTLASSLTTIGTNTLNALSTVNVAGGTTISAGTFNVNGRLGSALTVNSGASLKGNGVISGAATINGDLAPGASPGILSFDSSLTLGGNTTMEINGTTRGTQYDGINTTGLLTYGGTLTMSFGAPASAGTTFDLFQISGGSTGSFSNVSIAGSYTLPSLTNNSGIWTGDDTTNLLSFAFDQSTGDLVISAYSAIPEPSTFAAIAGLGVLGLGTTRRRRT